MSSNDISSDNGNIPNGWQVINYVDDVAVLRPDNPQQSLSLPSESECANVSYALYGRNGIFKQLRFFGEDKQPKFDVDYHLRDGKMFLHKHNYIDGVRQNEHLPLTAEEYAQYSKFLSG